MGHLVFSLLCGITLVSAVCALSDISEGEIMPGEESSIESWDKRSLHHLKHWLHKLHPHRLIDKIFHLHHENEVSKRHHWDMKHRFGNVKQVPTGRRTHWFDAVKPEPTDKPTHVIPKFNYSAIYPGTKWCGSGDRVNGVTDLGWKWGPDICCRRHHKCSHSVGPTEKKYGLDNHGRYTWFHCDCDRQFYECLKGDNSPDADAIGDSYFNDLNNYCIFEDYQQNCSKWLFTKVKCRKLTTKPKVWKKRKTSLTYA